MDRLMIFIDGSNLYKGAERHRKGAKIDFAKLRSLLSADRKLIRPYYYGSLNSFRTEVTLLQQRFHEVLERLGYTLVILPLRERDGLLVEKGADVALAIDMVSLGLRNTYDAALIVSGDEDFIKAIEEVKRAGKMVEVAYFGNQVSRKLRNAADSFIDLNLLFDEMIR